MSSRISTFNSQYMKKFEKKIKEPPINYFDEAKKKKSPKI